MKICVVSTSRADLGIYSSLINELERNSHSVQLVLTGCHSTKIDLGSFGIDSVSELIETGQTVSEEGSLVSTIQGMNNTSLKVSSILEDSQVDAVLVLGDRFEMHSVAVVACALKIPLVHFHGGELTFGAIDDKYRHSITQLSEIHFVSTEEYRQRVIQMGASEKKVHNIGSLALDNLDTFSYLSKEELTQLTGCDFSKDVCLLTIHPETLTKLEDGPLDLKDLFKVLLDREEQILISGVNLDPEWRGLFDQLMTFKNENKERVFYIQSLGKRGYFTAMKYACSMIGNSSSGIIEAASFNLPVLNLGNRQKGRAHSANIVNSKWDGASIAKALEKLDGLKGQRFENIYHKGSAAQMTLEALNNLDFSNLISQREFNDRGNQNV